MTNDGSKHLKIKYNAFFTTRAIVSTYKTSAQRKNHDDNTKLLRNEYKEKICIDKITSSWTWTTHSRQKDKENYVHRQMQKFKLIKLMQYKEREDRQKLTICEKR